MRVQRLPKTSYRVPETELTTRLKTGDEKAFEEIFFRYYKHLYAIALKFLKNPDWAEDAVQDIFLKLWDHRVSLHEEYSIKNFLSIAMKNHVMNVIRDHHTAIWEYLSSQTEELASDETTANSYQLQEYSDILERGLKQLPPQREKIFRLRVFSGLNNQQIAQQLSITDNTVKFQFSQATKFIKAYLIKYADLESTLLVLVYFSLD